MKTIKLIVLILLLYSSKNYSQQKDIEISYERNKDNSVDINYTKNAPGSYTINLKFPILENSNQDDFHTVVKHGSGTLLTLLPNTPNEHIGFSYSSSYARAAVNSKVNKNFTYLLPFKKGKTVKIIEAYSINEKYFKEKKKNTWKTFIIDTKSADTIRAMRKGIVIEIIDKYEADFTTDKKYTSKLNKIIIEHEDGTYGNYKGLNKDSFFVKLGQTVYPNSKLGVLNPFGKSNTESSDEIELELTDSGVLDLASKLRYRLYFHVGYYVNKGLINKKIKTKRKYEYVNPIFNTTNGVTHIKHGLKYTSEVTLENVKEEFSRREKKKHKKNPQLFQ
jgi:hypothetical protein